MLDNPAPSPDWSRHPRRGIGRRWALRALAGAMCSRGLRAAGDRVAVVYHSGGEAYVEAAGGLREALGRAGVEGVWMDLADGNKRLESNGARLTVALGLAGMEAVEHEGWKATLLPALVARADLQRRSGDRASALLLDIPVADTLREMRTILPLKLRAGLLQAPAEEAQLIAGAREVGIALSIAPCSAAGQLLSALLSLRGKVDYVLTAPDTRLFNAATVKPLIMASIENRLPLVGFSAGFVRAGAAAGIYPDFHEMGTQTAELVMQVLAGQPAPVQTPRKRVVAVNQRVARMLGIQWAARTPEPIVFR